MRGAILHAPGDVRMEEREDPAIVNPTDAVISVAATCVCGSDLWYYRGVNAMSSPMPMGHEYCGVVEDIGAEVTKIKRGQFVVGSFLASDGTCPHCRAGHQSACQQRQSIGRLGAQAQALRVPLADGTLVAIPEHPTDDLLPNLLAASDVLGTGWFAAVAAGVRAGTVALVVGDGAVGLLGVLAARQLGAERIIAMSRHQSRQRLAREFGATDVVAERGDEGVARVLELTNGIGIDAVLECVGTRESMDQAVRCACPGGRVSMVGVPHGVNIDGAQLFRSQVFVGGGAAPVRRFLPDLLDLIWRRQIEPGRVFDLALPLDDVAEGYRAMDERRAIKAFLRP